MNQNKFILLSAFDEKTKSIQQLGIKISTISFFVPITFYLEGVERNLDCPDTKSMVSIMQENQDVLVFQVSQTCEEIYNLINEELNHE